MKGENFESSSGLLSDVVGGGGWAFGYDFWRRSIRDTILDPDSMGTVLTGDKHEYVDLWRIVGRSGEGLTTRQSLISRWVIK